MRIRSGVLFLLFLSLPALAQRLEEEITVDLVEVPVHVTRNGKAIAHLEKEQFELFVNGEAQEIQYFDVIDRREAPLPKTKTAVAEVQPAEQMLERRRMMVLLFDTAATTQHRVEMAKQAAKRFVDEARPGDTFAVARMTRDGIAFVVPFTTDRVALLRAITTLRPSRAGDAFSIATLYSERSAVFLSSAQVPDPKNHNFENTENMYPNEPEKFPEATYQAFALKWTEQNEETHRRDGQNHATNFLGELADRLAPISGVKHVVYFSEGANGGADLETVHRMHARFQAAGVILDAVELDGMYVPGFRDGGGRLMETPYHRELSPDNDKSASLYTLALETGGSVTKHGDIHEGLRALRDMQSVTYMLAFRPKPTRKVHNAISVKVRNQRFGTTVTYRRGFTTKPSADRSDGLFLADVLMNDIPQRGVTLDLDVKSEKLNATVVASVPGAELLARGSDGKDVLVDMFLYVFDDRDFVVGWGYWRLKVDVEKGRDFLAANPYTVQQRFDLVRGRYAAKALMRFVGAGDVTGFQRADFEVAAN